MKHILLTVLLFCLGSGQVWAESVRPDFDGLGGGKYVLDLVSPDIVLPVKAFPARDIPREKSGKDLSIWLYDYSSQRQAEEAGKKVVALLTDGGYSIQYTTSRKEANGSWTGIVGFSGFLAEGVYRYDLEVDSQGGYYEGYYDESRLKTDGKRATEALRAAGYIVLDERIRWYNNSQRMLYRVWYVPPVGEMYDAPRWYDLWLDGNSNYYTGNLAVQQMDTRRANLNKDIKAAGYLILDSSILYDQPKDAYGYRVRYMAPLGSPSSDPRVYTLWNNSNGQPYSGLSGSFQINTDGSAMVKNFRSAGYIVTEQRTMQNNGNYGYYIKYLIPVK